MRRWILFLAGLGLSLSLLAQSSGQYTKQDTWQNSEQNAQQNIQLNAQLNAQLNSQQDSPAKGDQTPETYVIERDIPYHAEAGDYAAERCKLDFYYPQGRTNFPTVVWFHGGGLTGGNKKIPEGLQNAGMGIIAVNYRLMPRATVQECIDDAAAAVAWAFREVASRGGSTERIFVAGHSAGGYLTDMVVLDKHWLAAYGIDADRIAGAFPYSAQKITHFNVRKTLGMGPLQPLIDETAPLYHVRKLPMPMVVLSGDRELEMNGRYEEQAYFWRMMRLNGNDHVFLYEFDGYDHGGIPKAAHPVVKRYIRHICNGTLPPR